MIADVASDASPVFKNFRRLISDISFSFFINPHNLSRKMLLVNRDSDILCRIFDVLLGEGVVLLA